MYYDVIRSWVPLSDVLYVTNGLFAGPLMTEPLVAKLEPWFGQ